MIAIPSGTTDVELVIRARSGFVAPSSMGVMGSIEHGDVIVQSLRGFNGTEAFDQPFDLILFKPEYGAFPMFQVHWSCVDADHTITMKLECRNDRPIGFGMLIKGQRLTTVTMTHECDWLTTFTNERQVSDWLRPVAPLPLYRPFRRRLGH